MRKNKPLAYVLRERKMSIGKLKGQIVQVALPTDQRSVSFDHFCEMVADQTTFNYMEVASVLNLAADMARKLVANGDMVEFGRLGKLKSPASRARSCSRERNSMPTRISPRLA